VSFLVNGKKAFDIPYSQISRSVLHSMSTTKNDVSVELHQDATTAEVLVSTCFTFKDEQVTEIRFFVPNVEKEGKTSAQV
jgi:hypothetical protein